ncbi:hypothetical protein Bca4012_080787 [Brassica carinata]
MVVRGARWRSWLYTSAFELALALVDVNSSPKLCELGGVAFLVAVFSPSVRSWRVSCDGTVGAWWRWAVGLEEAIFNSFL